MTGLTWFAFGYGLGTTVGVLVAIRVLHDSTKKVLRGITPFDLARWQAKDRQEQVDAVDTRRR